MGRRGFDDIARGLAVRSDRVESVALDRLARAVNQPMPRRRLLRLAAGAAAVSFFGLRSGTARADCPTCPRTGDPRTFTQFCGHARGVGCLFVCCPPEFQCCQTDSVVVCCREHYECGPIVREGHTCKCKAEFDCGPEPGTCCEAGQVCFEPPGADDVEDLFCVPECKPGSYHCQPDGQCCLQDAEDCCGTGCCLEDDETCCGEGDDGYCCGLGYRCGSRKGECDCDSGQVCGDRCCPQGSACCFPDPDDKSLAFSNETGFYCCSPSDPPSKLDQLLDALGFGGGGGGAAAGGARGGSGRRATVAAAGDASALFAIAAVQGLAKLATKSYRSRGADRAYTQRVKAATPRLTPLVAGPGLGPAAASALNKLLVAEARAWSLLRAAALARARTVGAMKKRDAKAATAQAKAAASFAAQAATALKPVPGLRAAAAAALAQSGTAEVTVTAAQVSAFQAAVRTGGLPAPLKARLTQLGLSAADQKLVAKRILATRPENATGGVLVAPLADAQGQGAVASLSTQLGQYATRAKRKPIELAKPRPRTTSGRAPTRRGGRQHRRG